MACSVLIILGGVLLAVGLLWPWLAKLGLGRLPGDIHIRNSLIRRESGSLAALKDDTGRRAGRSVAKGP
ncbi:MAG: DUF2905 domain-containing protein [Burkholderiales bacterium]|nr:DUF2905 domain-containing protein [Burkholderiales bacterium]